MTQTYSVFQSDIDLSEKTRNPRRLRAFGFVGRVAEGVGIVVWTMIVSLVALTGTAQASAVLADTTTNHSALVGLALLALMGGMLAMVRNTWRQTAKGIQNAPRRSNRIG
ncbi:MAG: hypothetical protein AB8B88_09435 [Devosiaceae bacterium]